MCRVHHVKCQAVWITNWNQDCRKNYKTRICKWYHSNGRKWRGTTEPLDEGKRGEWKSWLKTQQSKNEDHGFWSHHFMANRWETMETVTDYFLGSKITADSDCSHEIKRCLLFRRKAMTNLDSILKSRDITLITLPTNVRIVKAMIFPTVMFECESWTIKKAEHQIIDAFKFWSWKRLRVPGLQGDQTNRS